ncbi:MAG: diaminopimelate epimerase, partial [Rhodobacteraceae bacterium]|nr:diaminopimelate epimerase [Paracoccaceae bacterium]
MSIETVAGLLGAEVRGNQVLLHMTDPTDVRLNQTLGLDDQALAYHFANTGVPHVVVQVDDLDAF